MPSDSLDMGEESQLVLSLWRQVEIAIGLGSNPIHEGWTPITKTLGGLLWQED